MKRITVISIVCMLSGFLSGFAGDVITDNLTVYKDATFYGTVSLNEPLDGTMPSNGLAFYANLNTNTTPVADQSGNGNTGVVYGATWTTNGEVNGSYEFGGDGDYIAFGDGSGSLDMTGTSMSVSVWIYRTDDDNKGWILMKGGSGQASYGLALYTTHVLDFSVLTDEHSWDNCTSTEAVPGNPTGSWHHVVATYNGSAIRFYWDGLKVGDDVAWSGNIISSGSPLAIGKEAAWNSVMFGGMIDEVMVYDRALSDEEISSLYNYFKFTSPQGGTLTAQSLISSNSISQTGISATNTFMSRVGIGTNSPSTNVMLHVVGDTRIDGKISTSANPASSNEVGNLGYNDSRYARLGAGTNSFTGSASFDEGVSKIKKLGDVEMGNYTNQP